MVRTKADGGSGSYRKAVAASAPRKSLGASGSATVKSPRTGKSGKKGYTPRAPVYSWPTPTWQKGIGQFLKPGPSEKDGEHPEQVSPNEEEDGDEEEAGVSGASAAPRRARPIIDDDDDDDEEDGDE
ncbi:hypothetical protein DNTS_023887 [Danionella cerebrum]|uniref:PCNA-associated factor n=1 Tax=Danionella cerebrum TaxID=2873325 RepID=A0A553MUW2_9TELE|nr:hypothetical protein DNTS_023887 [Danionella translucida]